MAWNNNIPLATHKPSVDQPLMQQNFTQVQTSFSVDHVALGTAPDGHHKQLTFDGTATGAITPAGTQSVLYPDLDAANKPVSGRQELWYSTVDPSVPAAVDLQITNSNLLSAGGSGMLPGGLQIRCGSNFSNGDPGNPSLVSFAPKFPTACISVVATGTSTGVQTATVKVDIVDNTKFHLISQKWTGGTGGTSELCKWIAIGY